MSQARCCGSESASSASAAQRGSEQERSTHARADEPSEATRHGLSGRSWARLGPTLARAKARQSPGSSAAESASRSEIQSTSSTQAHAAVGPSAGRARDAPRPARLLPRRRASAASPRRARRRCRAPHGARARAPRAAAGRRRRAPRGAARGGSCGRRGAGSRGSRSPGCSTHIASKVRASSWSSRGSLTATARAVRAPPEQHAHLAEEVAGAVPRDHALAALGVADQLDLPRLDHEERVALPALVVDQSRPRGSCARTRSGRAHPCRRATSALPRNGTPPRSDLRPAAGAT